MNKEVMLVVLFVLVLFSMLAMAVAGKPFSFETERWRQ